VPLSPVLLAESAAALLEFGDQAGRGLAAPGLLDEFAYLISRGFAEPDPQAPDLAAPQQGLERARVLRHVRLDFRLVYEHMQVGTVGRHGGEDLAAYPERCHLEMRFLACPRQGQRELAGPLNVAHLPRLAAGSQPARLASNLANRSQRRSQHADVKGGTVVRQDHD